MRVVALRETTLIAGAIGLWASGCLVGAALMLRGGQVAVLEPVAELSPGLVWAPRPESLFWGPGKIVIAPTGQPNWRTIVAQADDGYLLAQAVPPLASTSGEVTERPEQEFSAVSVVEVPRVEASTATEGEALEGDARPLIWATRTDAKGRKYRCLVPVKRWQASAIASADWQLRLAGLSPAAPGARSADPEQWLDPRYCEVSGGQFATRTPQPAPEKAEILARLNTGEADLRSSTNSLMWPAPGGVTPAADGAPPLDWIQLRSAISPAASPLAGEQGAASPIPRERVMQSL